MSASEIVNKPPFVEVEFSIQVNSRANNAIRSERHLHEYIEWLKQQPADAKFWVTSRISRTIVEELEHVQLRVPVYHRLSSLVTRTLTVNQLNRFSELLDEVGKQENGFAYQMIDGQYLGICESQ